MNGPIANVIGRLGRRGPRGRADVQACPHCGRPFDRLVDPAGRWFVCIRCGATIVRTAGESSPADEG